MNDIITQFPWLGSLKSSARTQALLQEKLPLWRIVCFLLLHVPLALAIKRLPVLALAHSGAVLGIGLGWALAGGRLIQVACVGAYIAGAEVFWRMSGNTLLWEFGKYATCGIFLLALIRSGRFRPPPIPMIYFLCLLPAAVLTLVQYEWYYSRRLISFNLSGPLAVLVSLWFFSKLSISSAQLFKILIAFIAPVVGVASIALISTFGSDSIEFTGSSSFQASGGFGPNQVSAVLGLGVVASFLCLIDHQMRRELKLVFLGGVLVFAVQSAMTFSRTGLYLAGLSAGCASLFFLKNPKTRLTLAAAVVVLFVAGRFLLLPFLDSFTDGALTKRFHKTDLTGRAEIMQADLQIALENPALGVGVGQGMFKRAEEFGLEKVAHTEFTRLLAEHGIFGVAALGLLLLMGVQAMLRARTVRAKALVASMLCFSFLFMVGSGMRLVLPALTFGLASVFLRPDEGGPAPRAFQKPRQPAVTPPGPDF
ncbi:MAG TPA: O-antigen ligase family protein [Verrucomicrobiae bacterium]|jgi:hypothetical protein